MTRYFTPSALSVLMLSVVCCILLAGCNEKPTDIGSSLVPGTDTIYVTSTTTQDLLGNFETKSARTPIFNSAFVLYGKTDDSEGRLFVEFVGLPEFSNMDSVEILGSDILFLPQPYRFGDTNDRTLSITAYELQQAWSAQATWDSIWAEDGSTVYYSEGQTPVVQFNQQLTDMDTTVAVPIDSGAMRRWLTIVGDSTSMEEIYGMVFLPTAGSSINQYRNLEGNQQVMQLRLITKTVGDTTIDTNFVEAAIGCFVDTPDPEENELLTQGARIHTLSFDVAFDTLPDFAIIVGAKLRLDVDENNSTLGTLGVDELMTVSYTSPDGSGVSISARGTDTGIFEFSNITPIMARIREDGGKGTLELRPSDIYEIWQMNRMRFHGLSDPENVRPYLSLVYIVPSVFQ